MTDPILVERHVAVVNIMLSPPESRNAVSDALVEALVVDCEPGCGQTNANGSPCGRGR